MAWSRRVPAAPLSELQRRCNGYRAFELQYWKRVGYTFRFAIRPRDPLGEREGI